MAKLEKDNYNGSESTFFQDVLKKYLPYWPIFLCLIIVGIICSYIYLRYQIPIYQAEATILIKDEKKGLNEDKILESLDLFGPKKIVENEVEVLKSRSLAKSVVKNLHLYSPIMEEGSIVDHSAYFTSPIIIEVFSPDSLKEVKKVYFTVKGNWVIIQNKFYPINSWVHTQFGVLRFLPNGGLEINNQNHKRLYFSLNSVRNTAIALLSKLSVNPSSKQSTVLNLNYKDEIPKRAEDILNELIEVYNKAAINDKNLLAANTLAFVEDRLKYVVKELDSVETALQNFKTNNQIVDISSQGQLYLNQVGENDQKINGLNMQLAVLDQVEQYVLGKSKKGGIVPTTFGVTDQVLLQLLQKLYDLELTYERLKQTTAINNPILLSLNDQIERIKPSVIENIANQRNGLFAARSNLSSTSSKYSSILTKIPKKERDLLEISRQQSIKNNIYTFLLQKREETALSYASTVADSRLIDNAEASLSPISPNRFIIIFSSVIGAILLGVSFVYFKEVINNSILFRSEIEQFTTVPILAEIINDSSKEPIVINEGKRTFIAEQFRQLRTALGYLGINSRKKRILVTSTISGEGKSFISSNLAVSLALMGKKVILIELDLRKPKLSEIFKESQLNGITNYFIGEKSIEEIIKPIPNIPNLFLISSGPIPPNPSELILNGKLNDLLSILEATYDYIIIDTCPSNPVTDAYIISPLCDATLYVIRHAVTPKIFVQNLDSANKIKELKNMAIIYNGIKERGFNNYSYRYGYGYGYGYTEIETKKTAKQNRTHAIKN